MRKVDRVAEYGSTKLNPDGIEGEGGGEGGGRMDSRSIGGAEGGELNCISHLWVSEMARRSQRVDWLR